MATPILLAVDLGIRTGLALYGGNGRLISYRSKNFGSVASLRRGAARVLAEAPDLQWVILEGGGPLAEIWAHQAARRAIPVRRIAAEDWRGRFFTPNEQRDRRHAKSSADELARRVIEWSNAPRPTSLRHDAAEAILIGLWAVLDLGWLATLPAEFGA